MPIELPPCDHTPSPYSGPSKAELLERRKAVLNQGIFLLYKEPFMPVEGHMQYLWDETGRRYLDCFGGICTVSVGHCHPEVTAALSAQAQLIQHAPTCYLHPTVVEYAEKLAATFPDPLNRVYFVNSGSEANDLAILMARLHTGHHEILSLRNCYHGGNAVGMALTSHHTWKYAVPPMPGFQHLKAPHPVWGPIPYDAPDAGKQYAEEVADLIKFGTSGKVAAYIAEPIQGVGGAVPYPADYLTHAYAHVREAGGVCIADEVQTGFGRTGTNFWGFQNYEVIPDIVVMAKSIGNGFPLAAVVTTDEIASHMTGRIHFNTFGGDPLAMAQGMATLDIMLRDNTMALSKTIGDQLIAGLTLLKDKYPVIADVRGSGLILGVEFVQDGQPASAFTADFFERCKDHGLIVGKGGLHGSVIRLKPPMCLTPADADFLIEVFSEVLSELS
ncbi:aspartate aminotransferase family protein [Haloferula sp.]|uniref:aspartate aminotransferase family protein n=1 Tax=Haloferula sp. TaxID=2497595 RepID=UPI003C76C430